MKRARTTKSQLTGGSGDVNPQYMVSSIEVKGLNGIVGTPLPIPRLQQQNGKQLVMEFLQIDFCFSSPIPATITSTALDIVMAITTNPNQQPLQSRLFQDPRVIALSSKMLFWAISPTAPTDYLVPFGLNRIDSVDLTDNAGHGILVATDTIYFTAILANAFPATIELDARIMYRFKEVGLAEYVGIVQSQQ